MTKKQRDGRGVVYKAAISDSERPVALAMTSALKFMAFMDFAMLILSFDRPSSSPSALPVFLAV